MKQTIIFFSIIGLVPFYLDYFFLEIKPLKSINSSDITHIYGCMIVSFLSGMQWQRFINTKKTSMFFLSLPMINFLWSWSYLFNKSVNSDTIIICSLLIAFLIEFLFQRSLIDSWFINLRVFVTFFAILSYFI